MMPFDGVEAVVKTGRDAGYESGLAAPLQPPASPEGAMIEFMRESDDDGAATIRPDASLAEAARAPCSSTAGVDRQGG
jgi:hypothetical protein